MPSLQRKTLHYTNIQAHKPNSSADSNRFSEVNALKILLFWTAYIMLSAVWRSAILCCTAPWLLTNYMSSRLLLTVYWYFSVMFYTENSSTFFAAKIQPRWQSSVQMCLNCAFNSSWVFENNNSYITITISLRDKSMICRSIWAYLLAGKAAKLAISSLSKECGRLLCQVLFIANRQVSKTYLHLLA